MINLPKDAINYFNSEVEKLISLIIPETEFSIVKTTTKNSNSDRIVKHTFTDENSLGTNKFGLVNSFGEESAIYFKHNNKLYGFEKDSYRDLKRVIEKLSEKKEIRDKISKKYIKQTIFDWTKGRFINEISNLVTFMMYLQDRIKNDVKERQIICPVEYMTIVTPFQIGNVTIDYFNEGYFEKNYETYKKGDERDKHLKKHFNDLKIRLQGSVYFKILVDAEDERAIELAQLNMEKVLTILRYLCPTAFIPQVPSYFTLKGKVKIPHSEYFIDHNEIQFLDQTIDYFYHINEYELNLFRQLNLSILERLFWKEECNQLEQLLLNCFYTFSRGIVTCFLHDKLVFNLVTLESILLKDTSEPIMKSLDYRLGFLVGNSLDERREIITIVSDAYKCRSSYLHHGKAEIGLELLTKVQHLTWEALQRVLLLLDKFEKHKDFIKCLDDQILS